MVLCKTVQEELLRNFPWYGISFVAAQRATLAVCVCWGGGMCVGGGGSKLGGKLDNTLPVRYLFEFFLEDNYFIT